MTSCTIGIMIINFYCQPLLVHKGIDLRALGIVMLLYNLLMSFGSKTAARIKRPGYCHLLLLVIGGCAAFAGYSPPWLPQRLLWHAAVLQMA